jgi:hypothetical protein
MNQNRRRRAAEEEKMKMKEQKMPPPHNNKLNHSQFMWIIWFSFNHGINFLKLTALGYGAKNEIKHCTRRGRLGSWL